MRRSARLVTAPLGVIAMAMLAVCGTATAQVGEGEKPEPVAATLIVQAEENPEFAPRAARGWVQQGDARLRISDGVITIDGQTDFGLLPSPQALRQVNLDEAGELVAVIERLGDSSFEVRENATEQLKQLEPDHELLYAALEQLDLSAEQRIRLLDVVREHVLHAPRGAIGIRMQRQPIRNQPQEILVTGLIPGLPAENVLQVDDRITHIDGERIGSSTELTSEVQARRPGDTVRLTIIRPEHDERGRVKTDDAGNVIGEEMDVEFELGSADLLVDPATGERQQVENIPYRRYQEVVEAYGRYGEINREIELDGEFPKVTDGSDDAADLETQVENHNFVRRLREEQQLISEGRLRMTQQLRENWELRQRVLMQQLEDPNLSPEERHYLQRVLYRYTELLVR